MAAFESTAARGAAAAIPVLHEGGACCTRLVDLGVRLGSTQVLEGVNLHVHCGELTAIVGANGAGKTTLLRAIMGELPHTGQVTFLPPAAGEGGPRPRVGYVPQRMTVDATAPFSVVDLFAASVARRPVWLGYSRGTREGARLALRHAGAEELLERRLGHLSCGQLQRVLLALALTPVPELLLLDEPLSGMDPAGTARFYEIVSGLRRVLDLSILLVTHDLVASSKIADRMVVLKDRTVAADGLPAEVLRLELVRQAFGIAAASPGGGSATCAAGPGCPSSRGGAP